MVMRSRATDGRSASRCQKNGQISPSAAVRGARITAAVRAARRSCQNATKAQKSTPVRVHLENPGFRPNPGERIQDVACGLRTGNGVHAVLPNLHVRLRSRLFLEQVMVSVACNGAHSLKERLARWLLMMRDRGDEDALPITQNLLAEMLGVQRPTITNAARELEHSGLIARGRRQVHDTGSAGPHSKAGSCECYQLVRTRLAFHLPKTYT